MATIEEKKHRQNPLGQSKFYGLFIGIDRYLDEKITDLNYAARDAYQMFELFQSNLEPGEAELILLQNEEATCHKITDNISNNISEKALEDDLVLIYFAGHGSPEISLTGDQYSRFLIPHDTSYHNIVASALDLESDIRKLFDTVKARWIVLIIDACFSGKIGGRTFIGPLMGALEAYREPVKLRDIDFGKGKALIAAADVNEVAIEDHKLRSGVFTHFLLNTLTEPDNSGSASIGLGTLYETVSRKVKAYTVGWQNPIFNGYSKYAQLPVLRKST